MKKPEVQGRETLGSTEIQGYIPQQWFNNKFFNWIQSKVLCFLNSFLDIYIYIYAFLAFIILSYQAVFISYLPTFFHNPLVFYNGNIFFFYQFEDIKILIFKTFHMLYCFHFFENQYSLLFISASLTTTQK